MQDKIKYVVEVIISTDEVSYGEEFDLLTDAIKYFDDEVKNINADNNDDDYDYIVINAIDSDDNYIIDFSSDEIDELPLHSFKD